ncbi:MAG TPA: hypothetical protein VGD64_01360 [Acidisarcina sp.]
MADQIGLNGVPGTTASSALDRQTNMLLSRLAKGATPGDRIPGASSESGASKSLSTDGKVSEENRKIEKSSRDFESILLGTWLQQAEQSFAQVPGGDGEDEDADPGKGQLQEMSVQSLAGALTASGGIGLAKMIAAQLEKSELAQASKVDPAGRALDAPAAPSPGHHTFRPMDHPR